MSTFVAIQEFQKKIIPLYIPQENIRTVSTPTQQKTGVLPKIKEKTSKEVPEAPIKQTQTTTPPPAIIIPEPEKPQIEVINFDSINKQTRLALVNIFCTTKTDTLHPLSGSGVFIDSKGIILTNAHVGQYFLLPEYINCVIRTGNPSYPTYKAKLLYISSTWLTENASQINQTNPMGTGENDYALLIVTERIPKDDFPIETSFIKTSLEKTSLNDYMLLASYPAEFLGGISISRNLYMVSSIAQVTEVFTFKEQTVDLFSIGGTVLSQKGSSGGAVVNKNVLLSGLIVTATESKQTSDRDLRAISTSHIDRSLREETGLGLEQTLREASIEKQQSFESSQIPLLRKTLLDQLK